MILQTATDVLREIRKEPGKTFEVYQPVVGTRRVRVTGLGFAITHPREVHEFFVNELGLLDVLSTGPFDLTMLEATVPQRGLVM